MEQQKVSITSSMREKGYSSPSHYRTSSVIDGGERLMAAKLVQWGVESLDKLSGSKVYLLRVKFSREERMSREKKNWLAEVVNTNTYSRAAVLLMGYRSDFFDTLKKYLVDQYGHWTEYYAPDRANLRAHLYDCIDQVVEIPKH